MAISLYDLSVSSYLQCLGAVTGYLDKASTHCTENGVDLNEIVETRLFADMLPFRFQLVSVAHHSLGALRGIEAGVFTPPSSESDMGFAELQRHVADARETLESYSREQVDALEGRDMVFEIRDRQVPFTAEDFVMSFSLPNLYFHATTAYDILRMKGVPLGKRDYMGRMRIKS